ncbi:MAG: PKD domain-containing protein [Candidatus Kariarchaeaceae archaeon]
MKIRFELAILVILITSIFLSAPITAELNLTADGNPPAPEFVSMTPDRSLYDNGTSTSNVTVEYRADRFDVEGLILLGEGSNLSLSYDDGLMMNLSYTYKQWAYYTTNITVSENTRFYAWAWHTSHDNGTEEPYQEDFFEQSGHYVFSNTSEYLPVKESVSNTTDSLTDTHFVAITNASITIKYSITNDAVNNTLEIALASNPDEVLNAELDDMNLESKDELNTTTYNYTLTFDGPELYFSVKSEIGWDLLRDNEEWSLNTYRITTQGVKFNSTIASHFVNQTNIDIMTLNVTLENSTDYSVGFFFRNYNSTEETNDTYPEWEKINASLIDSFSYNTSLEYYFWDNQTLNESTTEWHMVEVPYNATTTVQVYSVEIGPFGNGTKVDYYSFAEYAGHYYNETEVSAIRTVTIQSSLPYATISASEYYYKLTEVTFSLTTSTSSGSEIVELSFIAENTTFDLAVDEDSYEYNFTAEGVHTVYLNVTNDLNYSYLAETEVIVDHTTPTLNIISQIDGTTINSSYVMFELSYSDSLADIETVTVAWGDGTAIYLTGTIASHQYGESGEYTITITVKDKSGNEVTEVLEITVNIVEETTQSDTPIMGLVTLLGIMSSIVYTRQKRQN